MYYSLFHMLPLQYKPLLRGKKANSNLSNRGFATKRTDQALSGIFFLWIEKLMLS
jgi:hypothetical protein